MSLAKTRSGRAARPSAKARGAAPTTEVASVAPQSGEYTLLAAIHSPRALHAHSLFIVVRRRVHGRTRHHQRHAQCDVTERSRHALVLFQRLHAQIPCYSEATRERCRRAHWKPQQARVRRMQSLKGKMQRGRGTPARLWTLSTRSQSLCMGQRQSQTYLRYPLPSARRVYKFYACSRAGSRASSYCHVLHYLHTSTASCRYLYL